MDLSGHSPASDLADIFLPWWTGGPAAGSPDQRHLPAAPGPLLHGADGPGKGQCGQHGGGAAAVADPSLLPAVAAPVPYGGAADPGSGHLSDLCLRISLLHLPEGGTPPVAAAGPPRGGACPVRRPVYGAVLQPAGGALWGPRLCLYERLLQHRLQPVHGLQPARQAGRSGSPGIVPDRGPGGYAGDGRGGGLLPPVRRSGEGGVSGHRRHRSRLGPQRSGHRDQREDRHLHQHRDGL